MKKLKRIVDYTGENVYDRVASGRDMIAFLGELAAVFALTLRHPRKMRWREVWYYMSLCGSQSLPIVLLICYLMGLVLGFQAAVQMRQFGTEIYVADLVGFSILKELGPLMVAMIATGRAGSAFAAEIGTMKVNEEVSAMQTMGIAPARFLVVPKLLAMLLVLPILTVFGDIAGLLGGLTVGATMLKLPLVTYLDRTQEVLTIPVLLLGVMKSFFFAALIALVGCWHGFQAENDAQGVGRAATEAVVSSIFMVVIADAVLTIIYSFWGY
ncbi:ABC transporter permease [Victivallis sp. Marseille-Q1083]|uniref:MlaE family ABC transporter permease n=1 Tax=Victivallis sp. Marseille-Q1083 TaxID=2717288 RepID=UPI00158CA651|nr:ABC transporter permease [Victivallis sp. Marseille-Q1083]